MIRGLPMDMNATVTPESTLLIAIPCYGSRVLPRFGQARDFFFAEVDLAERSLLRLQRRSWDLYNEPQVVRWLRREGVATVLCGGIHPRFQAALGAEGICVVWGFRGEVEEILELWLCEGDLTRDAHCRPFVGQEDCPSRRMTLGFCTRRDNQGEPS